ncbi:HNH endonuclease [uncultured Thiodictyon sp.]|uniref:HNH endonuclease n=1 Tax=uncultured Thiodictyon sp. TaxID=1846217 RepID=UPI0026000736|nr:HNH endonuclease [uncultured Thiodictyon sp.]
MAIDARTRQILWGRAGATCAFPACRRLLVRDATKDDREVLVGEIAHIVAQSSGGPRRDADPPGGSIDGYGNLILLCHEHHELVDQQPYTYPLERLVQFKIDHEDWVRTRLSREHQFDELSMPVQTVTETVFSTIMPVTSLPHLIFSGECTLTENAVRPLITWPKDSRVYVPFIIRGGKLYAFNNMQHCESPFVNIVNPASAKRHRLEDWLAKPETARWYVELLNRTLNKITGRLGLKLDKIHHRYYFEPDDSGSDKRISYQSVAGVRAERNVAWNPHFRNTGEAKRYWEHMALGLRFQKLGQSGWGLAIRPERRFTIDGFVLLDGKATGRKSTQRKSRMYNFDLLQEVQFWRDFLSQGKPRISCLFGEQALIIDNTLMNASITWPEVIGDHANRMTASYEDDLFTLADLREINDFDDCYEKTDELETDGDL